MCVDTTNCNGTCPECVSGSGKRIHLPDCMMPDGAEPCLGYLEAVDTIDSLTAERDALKAQVDHTQNHLCMSEEDSEIHEFRDRLNRAKEAASEGDYEKAAAIMWDDYECTKFDTFSQSSQSSEDPQ